MVNIHGQTARRKVCHTEAPPTVGSSHWESWEACTCLTCYSYYVPNSWVQHVNGTEDVLREWAPLLREIHTRAPQLLSMVCPSLEEWWAGNQSFSWVSHSTPQNRNAAPSSFGNLLEEPAQNRRSHVYPQNWEWGGIYYGRGGDS